MASQLGQIQFIGSSYSGETTSSEGQRRVHSHAARIAHARARRLRTISYRAGKTRQTAKESQQIEERAIIPRLSDLSTFDATEVEQSVLLSPLNLLASDRRDPFDSFARSFNPIEHFLLDHCESSTTSTTTAHQESCCSFVTQSYEYYAVLTNLLRRKGRTSIYEHYMQQAQRSKEIFRFNDQGVGQTYPH